MKKVIIVMLTISIFQSTIGCSERYTKNNEILKQVDVFGIELFSKVDYKEINGASSTEEPCLKGYERTFDSIDIIIGYSFSGKIRKITTRNPKTSLFGIKPGISLKQGRDLALQAGFIEHTSPYKFKTDHLSLTFLIEKNDKIFGMILEEIN